MIFFRSINMFFVQKLEALATQAVLVQFDSLESMPPHMHKLVEDLFRYHGRYKLSSRTTAVFDNEGNRGRLYIMIIYYEIKCCCRNYGFRYRISHCKRCAN